MDPSKTQSVVLDVGTDNEKLLDDPLYIVRVRMVSSFVHPLILHERPYRDGPSIEYEARRTTDLSTSTCHVFRCSAGPQLTLAICRFVQLVRKHYPHSLLHFEDFGVNNAQRLLDVYRDQHAVFNDDV